MAEFFEALRDPLFPFLRYGLLAGIMASVAFGIVGTYVVARRIGYLAGAIAHSVLGGIGASLYLREVHGLAWCDPTAGALIAGIASALVIGLVSLYAHQREDTVIGAIWSTGMAVGLLFIAKTPGRVDAMSYLFGNIQLISREDLLFVAALDVLVVLLAVFWHNKFLAVCFDQEFAELRGVRAKGYYLVLLCLTALCVVLLMRVVGIVLVIALLTLPAAVAGHFAARLWHMMVLAVLFCMAFVVTGFAVAYPREFAPGPTIILVAAAVYLVVALGGRLMRRAQWRSPAADVQSTSSE
ncbi:MAG: metal ABC transporter permease [Pirellulaceae bacterium]|nr:metal ABC transporter permease [Pirellulaceae bacterium]